MPTPAPQPAPIRSVQRAFALLEVLADRDEDSTLTALAQHLDLPVPTTFRLMRTLVSGGYVRQSPSRRYGLGPGLVRLGERASHRLSAWAGPVLEQVVDQLQETANLAVLDGDRVTYVAQVPGAYGMRMSAEVGQRVHAHCSGVGKAILATLPDAQVRALLRRTGMPPATPATIVDDAAFFAELARIRLRGYAIDDGEQEQGVRCVATVVRGWSTPMAVSVSGPSTRVPIAATTGYAEVLERAATCLGAVLAPGDGLGPDGTAVDQDRPAPDQPEPEARTGSPATAHRYDQQLWP